MAKLKICIPKNAANPERLKSLYKIAKEYDGHRAVEQFGLGDGQFKKLYKASTGHHFGEAIPSVEQLKLLNKQVQQFTSKLEKGNISAAESLFYLPKELAERFPASGQWYKESQRSLQHFKGNTQAFQQMANDISRLLSREAGEGGITRLLGRGMSANREIAMREAEYRKLVNEGRMDDALLYKQTKIEPYIKEGEGLVFKQFHDLVTADKIDSAMASKYPGKVVEAAKIWREQMMPRLDKMLVNGIANYKYGFKRTKGTFGDDVGFGEMGKKIEIIESYINKMVKKGGGFPIKNLDIVPTLGKTSELYHTGTKESMREANELLDSLVKNVVESDININNVMRSGDGAKGEISYNIIDAIDSYTRSVSRFNMVSGQTNAYLKGIRGMKNMAEKVSDADLQAGVDSMVEYMADSYSHNVGLSNSQVGSKIARALTSWQAIGKMGFPNLRTPVRNAGQYLQNVVWFGFKGMRDLKSELQNTRMLNRVNEGLADNGILFPEITEIYQNYAPKRKRDDATGLYMEDVSLGASDFVLGGLEKIAKAVNKPMTEIENNLNRRTTFQLGYIKEWKAQSQALDYHMKNFERKVMNNPKKYGVTKDNPIEALRKEKLPLHDEMVDAYDYHFEQYRKKMATNVANETVVELHYDYDASAKPRIMRGATGSVATQFQTFSVNFFNYQRKIINNGTNEIMAGMWGGENAWRMYRLGSLYLGISGLSAITNTDLTGLVNNDTYERLTQWYKYANGDKEDRERAMFGRGISTLAGPTISDAVRLGQIAGFMQMDEDDWKSYMFGYGDFASATDDDKTKELVRTLNVGMGRMVYGHMPRMINGANLSSHIGLEFGLYNSKENKKRQEWVQGSKYSPLKWVYDKWKKPTKKQQKLAKGRREPVMATLDAMERGFI